MIDALKKNDKVVTTGGIYGTVISVDASGRQAGRCASTTTGREVDHSPGRASRGCSKPSSEKPAEARVDL